MEMNKEKFLATVPFVKTLEEDGYGYIDHVRYMVVDSTKKEIPSIIWVDRKRYLEMADAVIAHHEAKKEGREVAGEPLCISFIGKKIWIFDEELMNMELALVEKYRL
jgi:hypothetical protein